MKHLLTAIISVIFLSIIFITFVNRDHSEKEFSSALCDTVTTKSDETSSEKYYGDTLYQYDGLTVVYDYSSENDENISSLSSSRIVTYSDTTPVRICKVIGNGSYVANGSILKFAIGVDTVRYDMESLPDSINPVLEILPGNIVRHSFARSFALTDSSWNCDFKFLAYLPENHPSWLNQFIAVVIRNDIQALYLDNKGADKILKEYYGIKTTLKKVYGIHAANMTPKQIARHFANEHESLYRNEFDIADVEGHGPKYDYMIEVAPAWSSSDCRYVTYRFYTYYYTMGMHGFMEEYYLTFNNQTGQLLGYNDLLGEESFHKAISILEQLLTNKETEFRDVEGVIPASLEREQLEANASEIIKEVYKGAYYPRPALTKQGIVFTYQPYEKGAFCEGILHFVVPFSKLKP